MEMETTVNNIEILNLRHSTPVEKYDFKVDRSTAVGNPFTVDLYGRQASCENYADYFRRTLLNDPKAQDYLNSILDSYDEYGKVRLFCWCAPEQCHAETIRTWLVSELNEY